MRLYLQVKAETRKNQAEAAILKQEVESYGVSQNHLFHMTSNVSVKQV